MNHIDLKTGTINLVALLLTFTNIELLLKIVLSIVAIGYTLHKWILLFKNKKEDEDGN